MKRHVLVISLLWIAASLIIGCTKKTDQSMAPGAQQSVTGTSVAVAQSIADSKGAAMAEEIRFLNQHFVIADNSAGKFEPKEVRTDEVEVFFDFDNTNPGKPTTHAIESALAKDLDPDSVRVFFSWLKVGCKNHGICVHQTGVGGKNEFSIGPIGEPYSEDAKEHLKRLLLLLQGNSVKPTTSSAASTPEHDPLDGAQVQVAKSLVSPEGIRSIVVRNNITERALFLRCQAVISGVANHACSQPKLGITYTLELLSGDQYWMNPPRDDDHYNGKHLLVHTFTPN